MPRLVLASGSPRRRAFLSDLGYAFDVTPSDVPENPAAGEAGADCALRLARDKAAHVASRWPDAVVLAADTVVLQAGEILGKPADASDFARMMRLLSGRTHQVVTGVVVHSAGVPRARAVSTDVCFRPLTESDIAWYWATGEPQDKAGGYALQGLGGAFVNRIDGSHSNVVGLPLVETIELLEAAGIAPPWRSR